MQRLYKRLVFEFLVISLSVILISYSSRSHAQSIQPRPSSIEPPTVELDLDLRTRLASTGAADTRLYSASVRLGEELARGLRLQVYGVRKYNSMLVQQMTMEQDWGTQRVQLGVVRIPFGIY